MVQHTPRISLIIPTLQEGKLLTRVLDQFTPDLRQRYQLEIIVSDGGSTDGTLEIARLKADTLVEKISNQHQNISKGRNIGAKSARGDILIFINGDTIIGEIDRFFTVMLDLMQDEKTAGATCSVLVYDNEERLSDKVYHEFYNLYFAILNWVGLGMGRGECQVVRRDVFFDSGGYNELIAAGEDFEFFVRLRRKGKIAFVRSLVVRESPRRYRRYGYVKITLLWFLNAIGVLFFGRSVVKKWEPVR